MRKEVLKRPRIVSVAAGGGMRMPTSVERWGQWEGSWSGPATGNPFVSVPDFTVAFSSPPHASSVVRGFYDGDGLFKVRFLPSQLGNYSYRTRCGSAAGLDGLTGWFTAVAPSSSNHGPVVANGTSFHHRDGSPYHAIGTTVYGLFGGWSNTTSTAQTLASLRASPFNKVRAMAFPASDPGLPPNLLPFEPLGGVPGAALDLSRFNIPYWRHVDDTVRALLDAGIEADLILFNLYSKAYPAGLSCLGGANASSYDLTHDLLFVRYIVARLASFRNVWWSMSNEWSQCSCKWAGALAPSPCPRQRDETDPGCGPGGSNPLAPSGTPIWDALFEAVASEDTVGHLMSIHNNGFLYNYSRPWISHFSVQHTHNKPATLWRLFGRKPFVWDEVKYEGNSASNWGSLSAPQMVQRMWWALAAGAYAGHGEILDLPQCGLSSGWSGGGGALCGESPERIRWFRNYVEDATLHPPFGDCVGDDDGAVHTLTCGTEFVMFHFYTTQPFANGSYQYVNLPVGTPMRQDLLQPWEMRISLIWRPPTTATATATAAVQPRAPPPPGAKVWGPARGAGWAPVGILVDEDTVPHILTFTALGDDDEAVTAATAGADTGAARRDGSPAVDVPWSCAS